MESIWFASCPIERREPLNRNLRTDVAVIGAGITGILTAYKLQKPEKRWYCWRQTASQVVKRGKQPQKSPPNTDFYTIV